MSHEWPSIGLVILTCKCTRFSFKNVNTNLFLSHRFGSYLIVVWFQSALFETLRLRTHNPSTTIMSTYLSVHTCLPIVFPFVDSFINCVNTRHHSFIWSSQWHPTISRLAAECSSLHLLRHTAQGREACPETIDQRELLSHSVLGD